MWTLCGGPARTVQPLTFRILPGGRKIIGRGPLADFPIATALVSRLHCLVVADDERLEVEDLGSTNGTFVNGRRIRRAVLANGDRLRVGPVELVVTCVGDTEHSDGRP